MYFTLLHDTGHKAVTSDSICYILVCKGEVQCSTVAAAEDTQEEGKVDSDTMILHRFVLVYMQRESSASN